MIVKNEQGQFMVVNPGAAASMATTVNAQNRAAAQIVRVSTSLFANSYDWQK